MDLISLVQGILLDISLFCYQNLYSHYRNTRCEIMALDRTRLRLKVGGGMAPILTPEDVVRRVAVYSRERPESASRPRVPAIIPS
jgi:hypothetical protein